MKVVRYHPVGHLEPAESHQGSPVRLQTLHLLLLFTLPISYSGPFRLVGAGFAKESTTRETRPYI